MIHYHGGPIWPQDVARQLWTRRHAFVSFERPEQAELAAEVAQSFALDNGAFSAWKRGAVIDIAAYAEWCNHWRKHPGYDFAVIPDVIDGDEAANDLILAKWRNVGGDLAVDVPVWTEVRVRRPEIRLPAEALMAAHNTHPVPPPAAGS